MANIGNFDARTVAPRTSPDPVPAGWYYAQMTASEVKPTSDQQGAYLECEYTILDGQYAGRKVYDRLNLHNQNPTAVEIAYKTLSAICHAVGVLQLQDSQALHGRPLQLKVSVKPATEKYDANNEVKGYRSVQDGQAAQSGTPAAPPAFTPPGAAAAPPAFTPPGAAAPTFAPPAAAPAFAPPAAAPAFAPPAAPAAPAFAPPAFGAPAAAAPADQATPPWAR